jgi:GDP-4-dehydro-6-deoxy-D-mannose reductase
MQTIIITGINGFVGKHLVRELVSGGYAVVGIGREETADPEIKALLQSYIYQDIAETWPNVNDSANAIINLAGLAAVGLSFDQPQRYIDINSAIVTNIGEYYLKQEKKPRIVLVSSGAIYSPNQIMPLTEESKISMSSPYAVSKSLNESQAEYYRTRGLDIVVARPFNHIGPDQLGGFLIPDLIEKLKNVNELKVIEVGNLKTRRDYTDVRDVARAYCLIATAPQLKQSLYNVCSGKSHSGEKILKILQDLTNTNNVKAEVNKGLMRPNDPADIFGSSARLTSDTGWKPSITLEETLKDSVALS